MKMRLLSQMKDGKKLDFISDISLNFKDKDMMKDIIEICRCDMLGRAKDISREEINEFDKIVALCMDIFEKAKDIHATDMPKFKELPKNPEFSVLYRNYRIKRVFEK